MNETRIAFHVDPAKAATAVASDADQLVHGFPGPAALFDARGAVLSANERAGELIALARGPAPEDLTAALREAASSGLPVTREVALVGDQDGGVLDLTIVPLRAEDGHIDRLAVLARNVTLERNLRRALVESRQRYKDLVECSTDFGWETGKDGRFVFVSPRGALGYGANQFVGHHPREFLAEGKDAPDPLPFQAERPLENKMVWFRTAGGEPACLTVSSMPLVSAGGLWEGARGVCRDVTDERERDAALERARQRDRALAEVIREIRTEIDLDTVLAKATRAAAETLGATACWVFLLDAEGGARLAASHPRGAAPPTSRIAARIEALSKLDSQESVVEIGAAMLATAQHAHKISGVIAVARSESADPWTSDDHTLLLGVANQLGIAIEQAKIHDELQILSRTDALTGLLNRRAFIDEAGRRFGQARRYKRAAAVLYVDLNNFTLINDRFGHRHGDKAIRAAADLIRAGCRSGDVVARVGGDEFIIWLDETNATGAQVKATALVADSERLQHLSASAERPLGLAIGLAALDPDGDEPLDALVERADKAMYVAKRRAAVSSFAVAPAAPRDGETKTKER